MKKSQPDPALESPIPFRTGCNGEFAPRPQTAKDRLAERTFRERVSERARKLGVSRREFVGSVRRNNPGLESLLTFLPQGSCDISRQKQAMREVPALRRPSLRRMGPQTRREWLDFLRVNDGKPG